MTKITSEQDGLYDHLSQLIVKLQSVFNVTTLHERWTLFQKKLLVGDAKSFYILLTSSFVFFFFLVFAYYRLLELSKGSRNILKRNLERQAIFKDRVKNYMLNVLEDSII